MRKIRLRVSLWFGFSVIALAACGGGTNVQVSWTANREAAVNSRGGGYKVYFSKTAGFDIARAASVDAPFRSAPTAPTSANLNLSSGTYFIKVVAYSALAAPGGGRTSTSLPSTEVSVAVP